MHFVAVVAFQEKKIMHFVVVVIADGMHNISKNHEIMHFVAVAGAPAAVYHIHTCHRMTYTYMSLYITYT